MGTEKSRKMIVSAYEQLYNLAEIFWWPNGILSRRLSLFVFFQEARIIIPQYFIVSWATFESWPTLTSEFFVSLSFFPIFSRYKLLRVLGVVII